MRGSTHSKRSLRMHLSLNKVALLLGLGFGSWTTPSITVLDDGVVEKRLGGSDGLGG